MTSHLHSNKKFERRKWLLSMCLNSNGGWIFASLQGERSGGQDRTWVTWLMLPGVDVETSPGVQGTWGSCLHVPLAFSPKSWDWPLFPAKPQIPTDHEFVVKLYSSVLCCSLWLLKQEEGCVKDRR